MLKKKNKDSNYLKDIVEFASLRAEIMLSCVQS